MIKYIWFDFSETLAFFKKERHNALRYECYAKVVGKDVSEDLKREYEALYVQHHKSNAGIFHSLGLSANYWSEFINKIDPKELYVLADESIPRVLDELRKKVPISICSGMDLNGPLKAIGIDPGIFEHVISVGMIGKPKPALEVYEKMVELSSVPAENNLYVGDDLGKDVIPAKKVGIKTVMMWKEEPQADYSFMRFEELLGVV